MQRVIDYINDKHRYQIIRSYYTVTSGDEITLTVNWTDNYAPTIFPCSTVECNLLKKITLMDLQGFIVQTLDYRPYVSEYCCIQAKTTIETTPSKIICKDCKDGYYYPLIGPRELCQTCN